MFHHFGSFGASEALIRLFSEAGQARFVAGLRETDTGFRVFHEVLRAHTHTVGVGDEVEARCAGQAGVWLSACETVIKAREAVRGRKIKVFFIVAWLGTLSVDGDSEI